MRFVVIVCIMKPRLKTLWRPQSSLSALEFSFSAGQPHPQLPVGPPAALHDRPILSLQSWPFWEQGIPKFPCFSPDTIRSPVSLESMSHLYFPFSYVKWIIFQGSSMLLIFSEIKTFWRKFCKTTTLKIWYLPHLPSNLYVYFFL